MRRGNRKGIMRRRRRKRRRKCCRKRRIILHADRFLFWLQFQKDL
jgi:hypothetical protein